MKKRLDDLLVGRSLAPSKSKAQALIMAGVVWVNNQRADKAGKTYPDSVDIHVESSPRFVSRGGEKLIGALEHFEIDVAEQICLDVGASTGGFTDCLLQKGAKHVYALDVGRGQLHSKLRQDERVTALERLHVKDATEAQIPQLVTILTMDVSFIPIRKALPHALRFLASGGDALILFKPQFEAERSEIGKGVISDASLRQAIFERTLDNLVHLPVDCQGHRDADIKGPKGNQETIIWLTKR